MEETIEARSATDTPVEPPIGEAATPASAPRKGKDKGKAKPKKKAGKPKATKAKPAAPRVPVVYSKSAIEAAADIAGLVSAPPRMLILHMLSESEANVGEICRRVANSQPAVSHHLAIMRHARLIAPSRIGKHNIYSLTPTGRAAWRFAKGLIESQQG